MLAGRSHIPAREPVAKAQKGQDVPGPEQDGPGHGAASKDSEDSSRWESGASRPRKAGPEASGQGSPEPVRGVRRALAVPWARPLRHLQPAADSRQMGSGVLGVRVRTDGVQCRWERKPTLPLRRHSSPAPSLKRHQCTRCCARTESRHLQFHHHSSSDTTRSRPGGCAHSRPGARCRV